MKIHGLEKLSLVDYDGFTAATVFTGGCNFLCPFCHNAALVTGTKLQPIIPEEEVLAYLTKRKGLLDGVCVTGGEPTIDPSLPDFLKKVKDLGYSVKLDTNGTNPEVLKRLAGEGYIDYAAVDIKNSKEKYPETVGKPKFDVSPVAETVRFLLKGSLPYEFRTTITAELHDEESMLRISEWIEGAEKYFLQKFIDRGDCIENGQSAVPSDLAERFLKIVSPHVKFASLRGY